jgi:hypothetical protein
MISVPENKNGMEYALTLTNLLPGRFPVFLEIIRYVLLEIINKTSS